MDLITLISWAKKDKRKKRKKEGKGRGYNEAFIKDLV